MRRFIGFVLFATLLFTAIGGVINEVGAKFKSDERALAVLQKARVAIGGETAINNVRSMTIAGKTSKTFEFDGISRVEGGDVEINFDLTGRMSKMLKIGSPDGQGDKTVERKVDVVVTGDGQNVQWKTEGGDTVKRVVIKKKDGTEEVVTEDVAPTIVRTGKLANGTVEGKKIVVFKDENGADMPPVQGQEIVLREAKVGPDGIGNHPLELFRTTLSLLLNAPEGVDVSYIYAGDGNVDGAACDVINATVDGQTLKLFIDKTSSLPRMLSYQGHKPMMMVFKVTKEEKPGDVDARVFERTLPAPEMAEFQIKYSDYRTVGGLQFPFKWVQTVGGKADESTDVISYSINPANIADKFNGAKVVVVKGEKIQN